ncbi:MAG: DsbA family protein [Gammaproteobacteria bacterium]|nr:DsbA family protein [Gammaproteobacteria bacterium]
MRTPFAVLACTALAVAASAAHAGQDYAPSAHMPADGSRSRVVAEIDGQPVTFGNLVDGAHSDLQHQQDVYDVRRAQLDIDYQRAEQSTLEDKLKALIDQRLLEIEAKARHTTPLKLLGNVNTPEVTDGEVRALYDARKLPGTPPFEQVKSMMRSSLQNQKTQAALDAYYETLRAKYGVKDFLQPLRQQAAAIGPGRGPADAPITIVEFGDYQCPFCHQFEPTLESVLEQYSHQARLVFRNYPLTQIHPEAMHAAQAAVCADKQGKFWAMHDAIYADDTPLSISSLRALAKQVGLDSKKFEACVRSGAADVTINADIQAGDELGVEGTPTLFIDGRYLNGTVPREQLVSIIQDELERHTRQGVTASR